jgi:hypothetical protein
MSDENKNNSLRLVRPMTAGELKTRDSIITHTLKIAMGSGIIALAASPFRKSIGSWLVRESSSFIGQSGRTLTVMATGIRSNGENLNKVSEALANSVALGAAVGFADGVASHIVDRIRSKPVIGAHTRRVTEQQAARTQDILL